MEGAGGRGEALRYTYTYIYIYIYIRRVYIYTYSFVLQIVYSMPEYTHATQDVKPAIWLFVLEPHDKDAQSDSRTDLSRRQQQ